MTPQQAAFKRAVQICHAASDASGRSTAKGYTFGKCMKEEMRAGMGKRKSRKRK
jgi:hypothetical protein